MNPRVSRSSALASKATGYPIAKVAAKLAVGYTLDEIPNDLTGTTPGELRADARLRRRQVAALRVREVPGRRHDARHADEVGRRVDGHRPHVRRGVREGPPRARGRARLAAREPAPLVRGASSSADRSTSRRRARLPARRLAAPARSRRARTTSTRPAASPTRRRRSRAASVVILGSGPNRIGQGIEFDYCCVHAAQSFRAQGYEAVMVNCNPETVSTDYDTLRPALLRAARRGGRARGARAGAAGRASCIQFGGQTPLKLARAIERAGFRILGTPFDAVDLAEDRERFGRLAADARRPLPRLGHRGARRTRRPRSPRGSATRCSCARPTCSAGARCASATTARRSRAAIAAVDGAVLVDRFLENAIELDVDALCDGDGHVRRRGDGARRGGGDPLGRLVVRAAGAVATRPRCGDAVRRLGPALGVVGLLNVQLAIHGGEVYVLEVNPRASRTVPFASKATGVNLVDAACRLAAGARSRSSAAAGVADAPDHHVKAAVLPFARFPGADPVLGPEMRSTGEVMASAADFATAFAKAERAAGRRAAGRRPGVPHRPRRRQGRRCSRSRGRSPRSASSSSRPRARAGALAELAGIAVRADRQGRRGRRPRARRGVDLIVNTPEGRNARRDGYAIREAAVVAGVPCITTLAAARAAVEAIANARAGARALAPGAQRVAARGACRRERLVAGRVDRPVRACPPRRAAGSSRASRASSSCSRRPAACCRGRSRSASRREGELGFLVDPVGPGTRALAALEPGDELAVLRPARQRLPARRAPSAARRRRDRRSRPSRTSPRRSSARRPCSASAATHHAEAAALVPGAEVVIDPVLVTEAMPLDRDVLACGPEPMLEAVRALAPGRPARLGGADGLRLRRLLRLRGRARRRARTTLRRRPGRSCSS